MSYAQPRPSELLHETPAQRWTRKLRTIAIVKELDAFAAQTPQSQGCELTEQQRQAIALRRAELEAGK